MDDAVATVDGLTFSFGMGEVLHGVFRYARGSGTAADRRCPRGKGQLR